MEKYSFSTDIDTVLKIMSNECHIFHSWGQPCFLMTSQCYLLGKRSIGNHCDFEHGQLGAALSPKVYMSQLRDLHRRNHKKKKNILNITCL